MKKKIWITISNHGILELPLVVIIVILLTIFINLREPNKLIKKFPFHPNNQTQENHR